MSEPKPLLLPCPDGVQLRGDLWEAAPPVQGTVIVNPATGVPARYYHRYARFLAAAGFHAITYDYRGIGASRPARLRGYGYRWRDWGRFDFEAALRFAASLPGPLQVVGHSIGGFLPGFAESAPRIERLLMVGAQYAYWRDYRERQRRRLFLKWHLAMPFLTAACGYFPGRRLGWLEDLPAGVAYEWSFRGARMERSYPAGERPAILARFAALKAAVLAVGLSDDPFGTPPALARALAYYRGCVRTQVLLTPHDLGLKQVGHFALFHDSHREGFWRDSLRWLRRGENPWPFAVLRPDADG